MAGRTWEEKKAAYQAKHAAYVEAWKAKNAAWNAKEKEELATHRKAQEEAMEALRKETIERGCAHTAAVSAFNKTLGKY